MKKFYKSDSNLNININKDDNELNDFLFCYDKFNSRPNKIVIHNNYSTSLFVQVISEYSTLVNKVTEVIPNEEVLIMNEKVFAKVDNDIYLSYIIIDKNTENSIVSEVTFFFSNVDHTEKIQSIVEELNLCLLNFSEETSNNLNTIVTGQNGIEIEPIETQIDLECFDLYYSKNNSKQVNKLIKEIKKSEKGLSILYGERGTGKTSVVKYIASKVDRIVIFIPNTLIESTINNSEFRKFLKRFDRPIVVIDDCEMIFNDLFNKSNIFSNNLLQMIDGLLSDSIQVNVITLFNVDSDDEIDHGLLECNNLIKKIKFEYLSEDESKELSEHLGHKRKFKNKSKLIDIIKNRENSRNFEIGF